MPRRRALLPIVASFLIAGSAFATPVSLGSPAAGDFAGLVDIGGGRRLWLECRGEGSPTVLLEAGYRTPATVWIDDLLQPDQPRTMVFGGVERYTRVCAYDRPGVTTVIDGALVPSRSDPVPMPRAAERVAADLHALLTAAEVPGPYVLVGHSLGGAMVRLYAATYPEEIVGMVLVDAWSEEAPRLLTPAQWASFLRANAVVPPALAGDPTDETIDFAAVSDSLRAAVATQPLAPTPLVVLARGQPVGLTEETLGFSPAAFEQAWRAAQEGLARLTPDARFVVATESAHYVQLQQPDLVIAALREVVDAVRDPNGWATPET